MNTTTAEVATLEAAVRVLQVGNRQITQSVANQLDIVDPWLMTPMGRIKSKDSLFAIGRDNRTGDLVRAAYHQCSSHRRDSTGDRLSWGSVEHMAVRALYVVEDVGTRMRFNQETSLNRWWVAEDAEPWVTDSCPCCRGCSYTATGRWTVSRLENLPQPYFTFERDGTLQVRDQTTSESVWVKAKVGTTFIARGKARLYPVQTHTGTGNRFTHEWIESLPLIVLAGLR